MTVELYTLTEGTEFQLNGTTWTVDENNALADNRAHTVQVSANDFPAHKTFYRTTGGVHPRALDGDEQVFVEA